MKLTKPQLKQLIKEELETIQELETSGESGAPEEPARPEVRARSQAATASKATSLAARTRATERVTDPVAGAQILFKQLQGFSDKLDKATVMRNLIKLVKQSS